MATKKIGIANRKQHASNEARIRNIHLEKELRMRKRQIALEDAAVTEGSRAKKKKIAMGAQDIVDGEELAVDELVVDEEEPPVAEEDVVAEEKGISSDDLPPEGGKAKKHIHPCVCDLTDRQRAKIEAHLAFRRLMFRKHALRVKQIEAELARIDEERLEKERELQEQEELFGDEYEVVGKKRKRKKRSARRASMVSLGVKQMINWRKPPRHEVKGTKASQLRKKFNAYCGKPPQPSSPIVGIDFRKEPTIPIRETVTSYSRTKVNIKKKDYLIKHEDKRPLFQTPYYV